MKHFVLSFFVAASFIAASAQTAPKPAAPRTTAKPASASAGTSGVKLPPGIPPVHGIVKTAFSLRYQDIRIGTGPEAEPGKMYKVHYTGWLAADGHKFDSSYDHKTQVVDKEGKPELDADGKPRMTEAQPISFPQGFGRVIPGFDQGFTGMKVGGKRRLFIPWQLAYGARGRPGPSAANPGIPPKADLIFDIELVDMSDLQMPQGHPAMGAGPNGQPTRIVPYTPGRTQNTPASPEKPAAPQNPATPPPAAAPANPATTPPTGTPPASAPTTPPPDKPQSN